MCSISVGMPQGSQDQIPLNVSHWQSYQSLGCVGVGFEEISINVVHCRRFLSPQRFKLRTG
jgi:hypothetical protein